MKRFLTSSVAWFFLIIFAIFILTPIAFM
ncbi:MAG: hypothetical protein XD58_1725, partial [Thermotoga sp. 50_1627]